MLNIELQSEGSFRTALTDEMKIRGWCSLYHYEPQSGVTRTYSSANLLQHHDERLPQPDTRSPERDFGFPRYSSHSDSKRREHHKPVLRQVLSLKPSIPFQSRIEKDLSGYG